MKHDLPEIRQLPAAEPRIETGPIVFGEDWPGVFIRGDNAANYALHLRMLFTGPRNPISDAVIYGLISDLESSNLVQRRAVSATGEV